jgi:hypothetical protein
MLDLQEETLLGDWSHRIAQSHCAGAKEDDVEILGLGVRVLPSGLNTSASPQFN